MKYTLHLEIKLQPIHRNALEYTIPAAMKAVKIGGTCGGGTLLMENSKIENCI